jgi:hypothetical protein
VHRLALVLLPLLALAPSAGAQSAPAAGEPSTLEKKLEQVPAPANAPSAAPGPSTAPGATDADEPELREGEDPANDPARP